MVFYHKGLRVCKTPLPFVACARKAAIPHAQIWSAHKSDVVGIKGLIYSATAWLVLCFDCEKCFVAMAFL